MYGLVGISKWSPLLLLLTAVGAGCSPMDGVQQNTQTSAKWLTLPLNRATNESPFLGYAASGYLEHAYKSALQDAMDADMPANDFPAASIQRIFGVWEPVSGTMRVTILMAPVTHTKSDMPPTTLQQQLTHSVAVQEGTLNQPSRIPLVDLCPVDPDAIRFTGRAATLDIQTAFENAVVRALPSRNGVRDPLHFVVCSIAATGGPVEGTPDAVVTIEVESP